MGDIGGGTVVLVVGLVLNMKWLKLNFVNHDSLI